MRSNFVCARAFVMALSVAALLTACGGGSGTPSSGQQTTVPPSGSTPSANQAPTISGAPSTSAQVGQAYSFRPTAADADGDTLTFSVTNMPSWMTLNSSTGALTGTPSAAGTFANITVTVSDGKATASLANFTVTVAASTGTASVTLNWGAPTTNADGTALTNLAGYRILYGRDAGNLDQSISISNPSVNSYLVDNLASGTWYFAVVSVNSAGTESAPTNVASATV